MTSELIPFFELTTLFIGFSTSILHGLLDEGALILRFVPDNCYRNSAHECVNLTLVWAHAVWAGRASRPPGRLSIRRSAVLPNQDDSQ
jgi:hypothetical protein